MITVLMRTDDAESTVDYPTATKWHVDNHGYLHIIGQGSGNIGTHAVGAWCAVKERAHHRIQFTSGEVLVGTLPADESARFQKAENVISYTFVPETSVATVA